MLLSLFLNLTSFSQTVQIIHKDTTICFTVPQSKDLLKYTYKYREQLNLHNVFEKIALYRDSVNKANEIIIADQKEKLKNADEIQTIKDFACKGEKNALKSEITKQKRQKWLAIGIASFVAAAELYFKLQL